MRSDQWSETLKAITQNFVDQQNVEVEDLVARRQAQREQQQQTAADQLQAAEAAMRARGDQAYAHAQSNYASMAQSMAGAAPAYTGSSKTALNGIKGKGVPLGKAGLTTSSKQMTTIRAAGKSVQVNKKYQARFTGFITELASKYNIGTIGGYNVRNIAGTGQKSLHSYGAAIDINPGPNARGGRGNLPPHIAELAAKYGLVWGGNWKYTDPMHFEIAGLLNPIKLTR